MTPSKTPFAGLEVLPGAQDPLSSDGYYFGRVNPVIIDALLRVGAVTHKHDAHAALANPTIAPVLTATAIGGAIPSNVTVYVTYTLIDADGGETLPMDVAHVAMPPGYTAPSSPPTVAETAGGALTRGSYSYGVSITDNSGGETQLGPIVSIVGSGSFHISGLAALVAASIPAGAVGAGWRLWRRQNGGPLYLVGTGTGDTFDDTGAIGDCTVAPPVANTTAATNVLHVTVPAGQPAGTTQFAIYASMSSATFQSPSLLGIFPATDLGTVKDFTTLLVAAGAPPPVSRSYPGASHIDAETDLDHLHWHAPVATTADLPTVGNEDGDVRLSFDTRLFYTWDNAAAVWHRSPVRYPVADATALPTTDERDGDICLTLNDHTLHVFEAGVGWAALPGGGGGGGSSAWAAPVAGFNSSLSGVPGTVDGEVVLTEDTKQMWVWDSGVSQWFRLPWFMPVANQAALPAALASAVQDGDMCLTLDTHTVWTFDGTNLVWREPAKARLSVANNVTGLTTGNETARNFNMPGNATQLYSVTVDAACRVRFYPTTALASADVGRAASNDPDVAHVNGAYYEHTFSGPGTHILTPTELMVRQDTVTPTAKVIAGNVSVPAGTSVTVTLNGFAVT